MTTKVSKAATKLAFRHYFGEIWRQRKFSLPSFVLVGLGNILVFYAPALVVAAAIKRFDTNTPTLDSLLPYLLLLGGVWLGGEILWRIALLCMSRAEKSAIGNLYTSALDALSQKDIGFFHDNFAGSLTKKLISYSKSFEMFMDTLTFSIASNILPLFL